MPTLDLRTMPPAERHRRIFEDLDALAPGETLALVNDHRPSPLRYQLEATRAGQYQWEDGDDGPEVYTASITCRARILDVRPTIAEGGEPFYSRSEEHTSELQSLMRISYAVFCLKQNTTRPHQAYLING